jgi:predicted Zn finger-like uncharacterized protein
MKIVCDACSAKYSIADEKVRGKVFKIRCKKCSNIIVVRGAAGEGGEQPSGTYDQKETKVFDYSGYDNPSEAAAASEGASDAVWHVVIDQEQVGPMTVAEIKARFTQGEIDADSYIWREGFGDWERLADVDAFAGLATGNGGAAGDGGGLFGGVPAESRTAQSDPADLFAARGGDDGASDAGADLFGGGGLGGSAAVAASASSSDPGQDDDGGLFGSSISAGASAGAGEAAGAAAAEANLTGQRNENSVLFSLNNLAALASDSPRSAPVASSSPLASGSSAGMASGEGSGLIDIRSMAQVYLGDDKPATASKAVGSSDDLPVFSQTSFESASPVLLPTAQPAVNNRLLIALVGLIGVLVIAAVILVVVVLKKGGDDKPTLAAADTPTGAGVAGAGSAGGAAGAAGVAGADTAPAGAGDGAAGAGGAGSSEPAPAEPSPAPDSKSGTVGKAAAKSDRKSSSSRSSSSSKGSSSAESKPAASPPPPKSPTATSGCDEVTCLVEPDKPCCRKGGSSRKSSSTSSSASSNLPERPSRSDVSGGVSRVKGRVMGCNGTGTVTAKIKISSSGSVSSVSASGGTGSVNSCVERAVKGARFPKTQLGITVNYPFVFPRG